VKKVIGLTILYIACSFSIVSATDTPSLFEKAFEEAILTSYKNWAVTVTATDKDETIVERIDYSQTGDNRWQLISIDGKKPSKSKVKKYLKNKRKEQKAEIKYRQKNNLDESTKYLVNKSLIPEVRPGTITLINQTEKQSVFHFRPLMNDSEEKEMEAHLYGEMTVNKSSATVEKIRLFSKEPFDVNSAKIKKFDQTMTFASANTTVQGRALNFIQSLKIIIKGKAMGMFNFDEVSTINFTGYEKHSLAAK